MNAMLITTIIIGLKHLEQKMIHNLLELATFKSYKI